MDLLSRGDLELLVNEAGHLCVSILMPMHRGADSRQDRILLKNLAQEAQDLIVARGQRRPDAITLLAPVTALLDDSDFWRQQAAGLAIYRSASTFKRYHLAQSPPQVAAVNTHFFIKPLLGQLGSEGIFYVLAISQNRLRLLQCSRQAMYEVPLEGLEVPQSLSETMKYDVVEKSMQWHSQTPVTTGGVRRAAMYHATSGPDGVTHKKDLLRYCQQVDRGLRAVLHNERAPLVFAGVDYLFPIYREANTYAALVDEPIGGNNDRLSGEQLRDRAWEIVEPRLKLEQLEAVEQFSRAANAGLASSNISEIVPAAYAGRVGVLFADLGSSRWGKFVPPSEVTVHSHRQNGDDDLADFAAVQTLLHGGQVFPAGPSDSSTMPLAAIYRY